MLHSRFLLALGLCLLAFTLAACDGDSSGSSSGRQLTLDEVLAPGASLRVTPNPSGIAPLTALVEFETTRECRARIEVMGDSPVIRFFNDLNTTHSIPVLGLYADRSNEVLLSLTMENGDFVDTFIDITTGPLPDEMPDIALNVADPDRMEPGMTLNTLALARDGGFSGMLFMVDESARVRWYLDTRHLPGIPWPGERFANGNIFFGSDNLYEFDMLGFEQNRWEIPGYEFHHDLIELPDGNMLAGVSKIGATIVVDGEEIETVEDHMIEIDRNTGEIVTEWDFREILDVDRHDLTGADPGDWFHHNSMCYDPSDNTIIVSGRHQGMMKVNWDNELVWIMAPHVGWGQAGRTGDGFETAPFLLQATDADGVPLPATVQQGIEAGEDGFDWLWGQHAPMLLPNGNLFVFDNGFNRFFGAPGVPYSRAVEYKLDEPNMSLSQVWEYGKERGAETFSVIVSDVDYLPETGNRLFLPGFIIGQDANTGKVVEVTHPEGEVVFETTYTYQDMGGTGELAWGQIDLVYRSERMSLYPQ